MDYAAASDRLVDAAWALGLVCTALTLAMLAAMFLLRWWLDASVARRAALAARWRPRLLDAMTGVATLGPGDVPRRERTAAVEVWVGLQGVMRGDTRHDLNRVLVDTGLDTVCRRWLRLPRPVHRRVLAAVALGHLGAREDWPRLVPLLDASQTWLEIAALQGLMRIDPSGAATLVLQQLPRHPDWPRDTVRAAFQEAGPEAVTPPLLAALTRASDAGIAHWLPLVETGDAGAMQAALLPLLRADLPVEPLAAAIRQADDPRALPALRALADHPAWEVRTQVANALGRLGDAGDRETLRRLMGDRWWWVRYRAAQALIALPGQDAAQLHALLAGLDDRYARDALRQAAAERWLALPEAAA